MPDGICGLLPVIQTPFNAYEEVDLPVLSREIDWLFNHDSDGVVIAMVSEILRLSEAERCALTENVVRFVAGRGKVVVSVGAESSKLAERFAIHASKSGASAVMAIPPVSTLCGEDELEGYYRRILDAVDLPVIVQDASGYVGRHMSIAFQAGLFTRYGGRVMFKPEAQPLGRRLSELRDATEGKASIFEGSGGIALVDSYRRGIAGTMPGADLLPLISPLWTALKNGDTASAWKISTAISPLLGLTYNLDSFLAIEKHLLHRQGVFANTQVRGPVAFALDFETKREIDRLFDLALTVVASLNNNEQVQVLKIT